MSKHSHSLIVGVFILLIGGVLLSPLHAFRKERFLAAETPYISPERFNQLIEGAITGDAQATYLVGKALIEGWPVKKNEQRGYLFLRSAEALGSLEAQTQLAYCYLKGIGVDQNLSEALELYRAAANEGDPVAQYNLGVMYLEPAGVQRSYEIAERWLEKSALAGYAPAQANYGYNLIFFQSKNEQKKERGVSLLLRSLEQDWRSAYRLVAWCMGTGQTSLKKDKQLIFEYTLRSAQLGDQSDQLKISRYYDPNESLGEGVVEKNALKALQWKRSAEAIDAFADDE